MNQIHCRNIHPIMQFSRLNHIQVTLLSGNGHPFYQNLLQNHQHILIPTWNKLLTHIHKGIAVGEMVRVIRNTTSPSICNLYRKKIIKHFKNRGYPKHILKKLASITHNDRNRMLMPKQKRLPKEKTTPLIEYTEYHPTSKHILKRRCMTVYNDFRLMTLFPHAPTPLYKSRKKLDPPCIKKHCSFHALPSTPELSPSQAKDFSFLKFNHPKSLCSTSI